MPTTAPARSILATTLASLKDEEASFTQKVMLSRGFVIVAFKFEGLFTNVTPEVFILNDLTH